MVRYVLFLNWNINLIKNKANPYTGKLRCLHYPQQCVALALPLTPKYFSIDNVLIFVYNFI